MLGLQTVQSLRKSKIQGALKCICGDSFEQGQRNLSVGSIFILIGMACEYMRIGTEFRSLDSFHKLDSLASLYNWDMMILSLQDSEVAALVQSD